MKTISVALAAVAAFAALNSWFLGTVVSADKVGDPNPAYVCSGCLLLLGLVEESLYQVHLERYLTDLCGSDACRSAVSFVISQAESGRVPEDICRDSGLCNDECVLFSEWPVDPLPPAPIDWPIERRRSLEAHHHAKDQHHKGDDKHTHQHQHHQRASDPSVDIDYSEFKQIMSSLFSNIQAPSGHYDINQIPTMGVLAVAIGRIRVAIEGASEAVVRAGDTKPLTSTPTFEDCAKNISCHIMNFVDGHLPLVDSDGDRFAPAEAKTLRGSHWRGADCNDALNDVYPGRRDQASYDSSVDHNCNGIFGGNETVASFEELYCAGSQQRGLIMLGDSATAHFHIPPQWLTADGWNLDQLLPDAEDEIDVPHCSWGTGHVDPEQCPYQYPGIPDVPDGTIVSIYTQLRDRNRCNHNDFQNIGVNGARITSSMKLVDSVGRDQEKDHPVLAYLALIGNDVCNGHPGYDHMTTPEDFYSHAMESLNALDTTLPADSYVVAVALFNGELLYNTMHTLQHPVGCSYDDLYALMNCEEENPCWGWLNPDPVVRANSTRIANSLSAVYADIEAEQDFKNFKFIYYDADWVQIFEDYAATGQPLSNLVEPSDGFHPSQTGNAVFAKKFFGWLEENHPEAIGPINPLNDEIDRLFFSAGTH